MSEDRWTKQTTPQLLQYTARRGGANAQLQLKTPPNHRAPRITARSNNNEQEHLLFFMIIYFRIQFTSYKVEGREGTGVS